MAQSPPAPTSPANGNPPRYYKIQIKAWSNFDATQTDFFRLTEAAEHGTVVVTVQEIIETASELGQIEDEDVRRRFEIVAAAETVVQNLVNLPPHLRDRLRAALQ